MPIPKTKKRPAAKPGSSVRTHKRERKFGKGSFAVVLIAIMALAGAGIFVVPYLLKPTNEKAGYLFDAGETDEALAMWTKLADSGDLQAQKILADLFLSESSHRDTVRGERYLTRAAEAGDTQSERLLGKRFHEGAAGDPNPEAAARWLSRAALKNDPEAMGILGQYYAEGIAVPMDSERALNLLVGAAERGDPGAMGRLGKVFYEGKIVPRDYGEAEKWLGKSDNASFPDRNRLLGIMYYNGLGVSRNIAKATPLLLTIDDSDDPDTCAALGLMYYYGDGIPENDVKAEGFLSRAADAGIESAYGPLGTLYFEGVGGEPDYNKAFHYLRLADEAGDTSVCGKLGILLYEGKGVPRDVKQAVEYLTRYALTNRDSKVNALLGKIHYEGDEENGVPKNYPQANVYLQLAADDGDVESQVLLAYQHYNGHGVQRDFRKALEYLGKGVENRLPPALGLRGRMYYYGDGGEWNKERGVALLKEAAEKGDAWALDLLYEVEYTQYESAARNKSIEKIRSSATTQGYVGDDVFFLHRFRYGMTTEELRKSLAGAGAGNIESSSTPLMKGPMSGYSYLRAAIDGDEMIFYFRGDQLRYVAHIPPAKRSLQEFIGEMREYAKEKYLLSGLFSHDRGLIHDVFHESFDRFSARGGNYWDNYEVERKKAIDKAETLLRNNQSVYLLFANYENPTARLIDPRNLKEAYTRLGGVIERSPTHMPDGRTMTIYATCFAPLMESKTNYIWQRLFFGMGRVEALATLSEDYTVTESVQLPGFYGRGFEIMQIDSGRWHIFPIFNQNGLFALEFVPTDENRNPLKPPAGLLWQGIDVPIALSIDGNVVVDIFAADSPIRQALLERPKLSPGQVATLAAKYLMEVLKRAGRDMDAHWVRLPSDYRFVDPETGALPRNVDYFVRSVGHNTLKITFYHGTPQRQPGYLVTTDIYSLR